jgi:hypothetical protein
MHSFICSFIQEARENNAVETGKRGRKRPTSFLLKIKKLVSTY